MLRLNLRTMMAVNTLFSVLSLSSNEMALTNGKTKLKLTNVSDAELANATWKNHDWIITQTTSGNIGGVFDKRWTDFIKKIAQSVTFNLTTSSLSFSVWQTGSLNFHIGGERKSKKVTVRRNNSDSWNDYILLLHEKLFYVFENNHLIHMEQISDFNPNQVTVGTVSNFTEWKIPDFVYRVGYQPSQQPSILSIPPTGRDHIFLYTSLCTNCILTISVIIKKTNVETYIIRPTLEEIAMNHIKLNFWQETVINIDPNKEAELVFTRKIKERNIKHPFWKIGYKLAPYARKEIEHTEEATGLTVEIIIIALATCAAVGLPFCIILYIRKRKSKKAPDDQNMESHEILIV